MTNRSGVAQRSMVWTGLRIVLRHPGTVLWTYSFNLGLALLFSLRLHAQMSSVLNHSMAAERLSSAFDLGTILQLVDRVTYHTPSTGSTSYAGLPVYLLIYFVLVPGTLFSYQSGAPGRLSILLSSGLGFFWRFVRITLLTGLVSAVVLGPLLLAQTKWADHISENLTGVAVWWYQGAGWLIVLLVAAALRLYFDLVEVYTVMLGDQMRPNGKPDRRVRRVLLPALRTMGAHFGRAYGTFTGLALLGMAGLLFTGRIALHMLAQPRVWPVFLLAQAGLLAIMTTRFWQRGAETVLACDNRLPPQPLPPGMREPLSDQRTRDLGIQARRMPTPFLNDAQPDPEPAAPSLNAPDKGVFHHQPGTSNETGPVDSEPL